MDFLSRFYLFRRQSRTVSFSGRKTPLPKAAMHTTIVASGFARDNAQLFFGAIAHDNLRLLPSWWRKTEPGGGSGLALMSLHDPLSEAVCN